MNLNTIIAFKHGADLVSSFVTNSSLCLLIFSELILLRHATGDIDSAEKDSYEIFSILTVSFDDPK